MRDKLCKIVLLERRRAALPFGLSPITILAIRNNHRSALSLITAYYPLLSRAKRNWTGSICRRPKHRKARALDFMIVRFDSSQFDSIRFGRRHRVIAKVRIELVRSYGCRLDNRNQTRQGGSALLATTRGNLVDQRLN